MSTGVLDLGIVAHVDELRRTISIVRVVIGVKQGGWFRLLLSIGKKADDCFDVLERDIDQPGMYDVQQTRRNRLSPGSVRP